MCASALLLHLSFIRLWIGLVLSSSQTKTGSYTCIHMHMSLRSFVCWKEIADYRMSMARLGFARVPPGLDSLGHKPASTFCLLNENEGSCLCVRRYSYAESVFDLQPDSVFQSAASLGVPVCSQTGCSNLQSNWVFQSAATQDVPVCSQTTCSSLQPDWVFQSAARLGVPVCSQTRCSNMQPD